MAIIGKMTVNEIHLRIPYADTDQMGMVYYANYLVYFERGRTEWLRQHAVPYRGLEEKGLYFPVMECSCNYHAPARYDEVLTVKTTISAIGLASVEFSYEITCGEKLIATGKTKHPLVNRRFRPVRLPEELRRALERSNA